MAVEVRSKELYTRALKLKGEISQIDISVEECAEYIQSLIKIKRCNEGLYEKDVAIEKSIEEAVDVIIMIEQMIITFNKEELFNDMKKRKLDRLDKRLNLLEEGKGGKK